MKKLILGTLLGGSFLAANAAEMNGAFIGLELGVAPKVEMKHNLGMATTDNASIYGLNVGYKHFITDWFGLRYYASFDYLQSSFQWDIPNGGQTNTLTRKFNNMIYAGNADALFNFYNGESSSVGAFVGFGVGYQNWKPTMTNFIQIGDVREGERAYSFSVNGLYADFKAGLRVSAGHHGFDFIFKLPITHIKKTYSGSFDNGAFNSLELTLKQSYSFFLGYSFTF